MRPGSIVLHCPVCAGPVPLAAVHAARFPQRDAPAGSCSGCGAPLALTRHGDAVRLDLALTAPPSMPLLRPADPLTALLATLDLDRIAMKRALDTWPSDARRQMLVRRGLLVSLEAYVAALGRRNLPTPPRLRDELSLQRALVAR